MALFKKEIKEDKEFQEKTLRSEKTHSGGISIITFILSSIWKTVSKVSSTWLSSKTIEKDE